MENLNKANFWNEMQQKYPKAVKEFCDWVDGYKARVGWNNLFNHGVEHYVPGSACTSQTHAPKFHDLPLAIQMGIWQEYLCAYDLNKCKLDIETLLYGFEEGLQMKETGSNLEIGKYLSFDELVQHGINNGANIVEGMPWSWQINGYPITQEDRNTYLVLTVDGLEKLRPGNHLLACENGLRIMRVSYSNSGGCIL